MGDGLRYETEDKVIDRCNLEDWEVLKKEKETEER